MNTRNNLSNDRTEPPESGDYEEFKQTCYLKTPSACNIIIPTLQSVVYLCHEYLLRGLEVAIVCIKSKKKK